MLRFSTVPANLDETLRENARQGNYILAIGAKLHVLDEEEEIHHVHRKQIDKDLVFLGTHAPPIQPPRSPTTCRNSHGA
jgi:hypothetical protein